MNVAFVQPNFQTGPRHLNAFYLPYTIGILWSYASQYPHINENFSVKHWIFRRDPVEQVVKQLADCEIVFFSLYVWNREYCFEIAKKLKELNPKVYTVFGGPDLPHRNKNLFDEFPFIDVAVIGEGEHMVYEILDQYLQGNRPNKHRAHAPRIRDLEIPSPYLTGIFDELIAAHPDIEWMPTLETDRGCPYKCTFCDWGSLTSSKVVKFGLERVFAELEWFSKMKMSFLTMTNANFGIFKERDILITDKIVELSRETGYPTGISVSYAKNSNKDVFDIVRKFQEVNIQTGFVLSLQTTTDKVLENVKRTNMNINDVSEITNYGRSLQLPIYTEIIMGLPGETLESWKQNIENILDAGLHNGIDAFLLNMIENAPMIDDIEKYDLKTFAAYDMFYETSDSLGESNRVNETIQVVKSTSTLTVEELLETIIYTWFVIGFHIYGISDIIAIYLKRAKNVSYKEFYDKLIDQLRKDQSMIEWENKIRHAYLDWHKTGIFKLNLIGLKLPSWQVPNSMSLIMHQTDTVDYYIDIVKDFVVSNYDIDTDIINDYEVLSKNRIKQWGRYNITPKQICTNTTLFDFTQNLCYSVINEQQQYLIADRYNQFPTELLQHIDYIIYGRRKMWVLNVVDKL